MNLALWILQGLLAAAFAIAGLMKLTRPVPELAARMKWVTRVSPGTVRFVGLSELLGGVGLIVPWASHVVPILTPIAAAALVVVMLLAVAHHVQHHDKGAESMPALILGALAAFVAWGRF